MMTNAQLKQTARQALAGQWGNAILVVVIYGLILAALSVTGVGPLILTGPMSVGLAVVFMGLIRQESVSLNNLFDGFNNFGTNCAAGVLVGLFTALWSMLFVIPGIVKSLSYSQTFYLLRDYPGLSATEAINTSRKLMDGHKAELFVLQLSFIGWWILCMLTFGLLSLYVTPYYNATMAAYYENLKQLQNW